MRNLSALDNGCGVGFTVLYNGQPENFKLGLFMHRNRFKEENEFLLGYINTFQTLFIESVYSGGCTGFGAHDISPWDEAQKNKMLILVTTVLSEIQDFIKAEVAKAEAEAEARKKDLLARYERIMALPEVFESKVLPQYFRFERTAPHNPTTHYRWFPVVFSKVYDGSRYCEFSVKSFQGKFGGTLFSAKFSMFIDGFIPKDVVDNYGGAKKLLTDLVAEKKRIERLILEA